LEIKTKIVSCHTADSKPVKQEVNGTVILPTLVFPENIFKMQPWFSIILYLNMLSKLAPIADKFVTFNFFVSNTLQSQARASNNCTLSSQPYGYRLLEKIVVAVVQIRIKLRKGFSSSAFERKVNIGETLAGNLQILSEVNHVSVPRLDAVCQDYFAKLCES